MKKIILLINGILLSNFSFGQEGCTEAPNGEYPEYVYTPVCNGNKEFITEYGFSGEYSSVELTKGVTYEFQGSLDTDFLTITDSTGLNVKISGNGIVTYTATDNEVVRFYLHINENCESNFDDLKMRSVKCKTEIVDYCQPILDCSDGAAILNFSANDFTNTTTCSTNGYNDFSDLEVTFSKTEANLLDVKIGYGWYEESVSMWIDFNNNFIFEENEFFYIGEGTNTTLTKSIEIPEYVQPGSYRLRLRLATVGANHATWDKSCDVSQFYGETEDYTVNIVEKLGLNETYTSKVKLYPNPVKDILNITKMDKMSSLDVIDSSGKIVLREEGGEKLNLTRLKNGVYLVKIYYIDGSISTHKIIKE